jgi:dTDP-4-dehydrorhamnose reductase
MKTLILGANGMLGHALAYVFKDYKPVLWRRSDLDITSKTHVLGKITEAKPDLIINSAAFTDVDGAEENEDIATQINGDGVGYLVQASQQVGATLVHFSTDYVFDGTKKNGYTEHDKPNPINAYGRSKLAGEDQILRLAQNDGLKFYIIRTSWLYGEHGKNFVDTMLGLAKKGEPIKVVNDQFGSPTYTVDLALAIKELIESKAEFGIYHRTNSGVTSWYEFAKEIFSVFGAKANLLPCTTEEYPRKATRPQYSILKSTKLQSMRPWQDALKEYKK